MKLNRFSIFLSRLLRVRCEIKWLAGLAMLSILSIEFFFNKIDAPYTWVYELGVIYLRLCYSFFASFIFYLVAVFFPKERKRTKGYLMIHNRISFINREVSTLLLTILKPLNVTTLEGLTEEDLEGYFSQINPSQTISVNSRATLVTFLSHYDYFCVVEDRIITWIRDILPLYDIIHDDPFKQITEIYDHVQNFFSFKLFRPPVTSLKDQTYDFFELFEKTERLEKLFRKKYKGYTDEFHFYEQARNKENL
jgi:hypothetical protein